MSKEEEATAPPAVDTDSGNTTPSSSSLWNLLSPTNYVPTNLSSMLQQSNIDLASVLSSGGEADKQKELYGGNGSNSLDEYEGEDSAASLQKQSSIDRNRSVNTTNIQSNNLDIITESNYDEMISPTSIQSYTTVESGTTGSDGSLSYTDTDTRTYDDGLSHDGLTDNDDLEDIDMEESLTSLQQNIVPLPSSHLPLSSNPADHLAASHHSNQQSITKSQHRSKSKLLLLVTVLTILVCGGVALSLGVSLSDLGFGSDESGSENEEGGEVVINYLPAEPTTTIEEDEVVEEVDCDEFGMPIVEILESDADVDEQTVTSEVSPVESEAEEQTAVPIEPNESESKEAQELPDNITCEQINQVMSHQMVTLATITAYHKDGTLPEGITEEIMGPVLEVQAPGVTMESLREVSPEMVIKCQQGGVRRRKLRKGGGLKSRVSRRNLLRGGRPAHHNKVNRRRRTFKCKPKQATQEEKEAASEYASNLLAALEEESKEGDDTLVLEGGDDTTEEEEDDKLVLEGGDSTTTENQEEEEVAIVEEEEEEQVEELNIGGFTGGSSTSEGSGGIGGFTGTSEGSGGIGGFTGGVGGFTGTSESTAAPSPQPITPEPTPLPSPPPSLAPITSKPTNEPTVNTPSPTKAPITMEPSDTPTVSYFYSICAHDMFISLFAMLI